MKVLETAVGAVFAPTRFSLVRISIRDLVADGKSLVRNSGVGGGGENLILINLSRKVADVWKKDVWEFQAKSGSSGSRRLFLHFLGKIAVRKMSGRTPGNPRHSLADIRGLRIKENLRDNGRLSQGHPAGQAGVQQPVSHGLALVDFSRTDAKGHFCRDTGPF